MQPSELAKLAVIFYLAWFLEMRRQPDSFGMNDWKHTILPAIGPVLVLVGLIVIEPDLGTAVEIFIIAVAMMYVAGLNGKYIVGAGLAAIPVIYLLIVRVPYRLERVIAFLNPTADPQGRGFQLMQSLIAVGSGGFTGVGLMESKQKLFYLPEAHTDFIFAVLCEELGFIGGAIVLTLFVIYGWRGIRSAFKTTDDFGRLAALGITVMVLSQALINLGVVLGMMPTKGPSVAVHQLRRVEFAGHAAGHGRPAEYPPAGGFGGVGAPGGRRRHKKLAICDEWDGSH